MPEKIYIFDTTLRDGEQAPGFSMGVDEKIKMALQLEKLNVDVIEAGFPISSEGDFEAVSEIAKIIKGPEIAALARTNEEDIERAWEALKWSPKGRIHIFIATSPIHMKYKLRLSPEEVLEKAVKAVEYGRKFTDNIEFSAEDATRSERDFLVRVFKEVVRAGARVINIPDTVGYTTPDEFYSLVSFVRERVREVRDVIISVHCHNDLGLAVANSLSAIKAGARQVECTINGIGERAGNASLEEIVMGLKTRKDVFDFYTDVVTTQIYPTSKTLSLITGISVQPNKAIVGRNAFAHEAGIHQDGVLKEKTTYEIMKPEDIGLPSNMLVLGKHSGRHALKERLKSLGYELADDEINEIFKRVKALADRKKEIYDEDLEAIVAEEIFKGPEKYKLISVNFASGMDMIPTATVVMEIDGKVAKEIGWGNGPVDAVYRAIQKITQSKCRLSKFVISAITGGTDAQGEVTVHIEEEGNFAVGRGAHTDVVVASAKAFVNALNRLELRKNLIKKVKAEL
jgi:2-isopropylmalate synthase